MPQSANTFIYLHCICLLLLPLFALSQQRPAINGRVVTENGISGIDNVLVINYTAQRETYTDSLGYFTVNANLGDLLVISNHRILEKKIRYTQDLIKKNLLLIPVAVQVTELEEVKIAIDNNLTAEGLGIVAKNQKKYTPAERKLYTAGDFKPIHLLGLLAGSLEVDPIINAINGKTKRLKKEIKMERREAVINKVNDLYTPQELATRYNIPLTHTTGFLFYIAEDAAFADALLADDATASEFRMAALAQDYLELLSR